MSRAISTTPLPGLRSLLRGRNLSQVARDLGIDRGFLSQLVSCKRGASLAMARRLAIYLDTTIETLLNERPPEDA